MWCNSAPRDISLRTHIAIEPKVLYIQNTILYSTSSLVHTFVGVAEWVGLDHVRVPYIRQSCDRVASRQEDSTYGLRTSIEFAPGKQDVGRIHAISAGTGRTDWKFEQRAGVLSLVTTENYFRDG